MTFEFSDSSHVYVEPDYKPLPDFSYSCPLVKKSEKILNVENEEKKYTFLHSLVDVAQILDNLQVNSLFN